MGTELNQPPFFNTKQFAIVHAITIATVQRIANVNTPLFLLKFNDQFTVETLRVTRDSTDSYSGIYCRFKVETRNRVCTLFKRLRHFAPNLATSEEKLVIIVVDTSVGSWSLPTQTSVLDQLATVQRHVGCLCDATETGGTPPVTTTNDTMPPPWRRQAALVWLNETFLLPISWRRCMGSKTASSKIKRIKW